MTYIWNRADRVPEDKMPEAITQPFQKWCREKSKVLSKTKDDKVKKNILYTLKRQGENYSDALASHKLKQKFN